MTPDRERHVARAEFGVQSFQQLFVARSDDAPQNNCLLKRFDLALPKRKRLVPNLDSLRLRPGLEFRAGAK